MAFHLSCPITCRRMCDCALGFAGGLRSEGSRKEFLKEVEELEEFLGDPWLVRPDGAGAMETAAKTVQIWVPKVAPVPAPVAYGGDGDDGNTASAHARLVALQRQAVEASLAVERCVRKMEVTGAADSHGEHDSDLLTDDKGSAIKVMCRICFSGENEGSERAMKMLSCQSCNKKYHRSCLKIWAEHRDLFHWSSWVCASCRICEVCRRSGDPNKLMFCKRCDGAYHCYCQQPPHKNINHGPYVCPKHTRCHSCGSTVPGSGPSTRWFLGYTCCDACGRLFVKGNYCPVCLKVYRDSETTPMVCCDICERWVHCICDGISDEKYQQFQTDQNLQYVCAACRGDCYQVKDIDDAVRELWSRRDETDRDIIASLKAAAGFPTEESVFSTMPFSDSESDGPVVQRTAYGRSLKFSVKGLTDKSTKVSKESGKTNTKTLNLSSNNKSVKKKDWQIKFVSKSDGLAGNSEVEHSAISTKTNLNDIVFNDLKSRGADGQEGSSPVIRMKNSIAGNEVGVDSADRAINIQNKERPDIHLKECAGKTSSNGNGGKIKGTKLVIHIGGRNKNVTNSPASESSSCQREQDLSALHGSENTSQVKLKNTRNGFEKAHATSCRLDGEDIKQDTVNEMISSKHVDEHKNFIKLGKISDLHRNDSGNTVDQSEPRNALRSPVECTEVDGTDVDARLKSDAVLSRKPVLDPNLQYKRRQTLASKSTSGALNDSKILLKLKFKNPYFENKSSWAPRGEEETSVKGQRSKRKRPSMEKNGFLEDEGSAQQHHKNTIDEAMDANWILQKLGKDAIGKTVEVHQKSDDSWRKGVVSDLAEGASSLSVHLNDGKSMTLELEKQRVRFIPKKHKKVKK
ncbi:Histone-lysine N-methyltransferase ATX3 [Apostasia shenzhenica]|uniref:Histone-lysine N-methyltransferase ATX3 n=1 Tax=Apostasia shenzhenica TaxID=1088818 RepID=A0A2I0ARR5_9ASPA|nr:Histone-lysine N-methyltransferase ATX3 [Apostasia shenzhenica]